MISLNALSLKDKISNGRAGDYIVTEQNHFCSLIRIQKIMAQKITIEEISFPERLLPNNFEAWLKADAKGNTSWSVAEFDLSTNNLLSCFSYTKNTQLIPNREDSFLLTILDLKFSQIPDDERRKIGGAPQEGQDTRKIWTPPLYYEGKKELNTKFSAYKTTYPKDGSILSGKFIELFFTDLIDSFPFPHWGQVTDASEAGIKFRVIASGRNLSSPKNPPL